MRTIILIGLMTIVTALKAQTFLPGSSFDNSYRGSYANNMYIGDSSSAKKWSITRFNAISASYAFFKGGSATILSAPIGLQLNRRINNNLYAFASVSLEPAYVNFHQAFLANDFNKGNQQNNFFNPGGLNVYSRAALGLQYINDDKTFSISGSIGVERSGYPMLPYNQMNNTKTSHIMPANR